MIHSEKDDIWDRMTRVEAYKLDDKLQEAIQYGNYHKKIGELTSLYDCKDMEFELMENDNVYLNRVIRKLWSELAAKQEELVSVESEAVTDFRRKTDEKFHQIDGMGAAEIESIVFDYIQSKIEENNLDIEIVGVIVSGSRCRGLEKVGSDLDVVLEYKGNVREDILFDILHEDRMEIGGVEVDINPITEKKSGTLTHYLAEAEIYLSNKNLKRKTKKSIKEKLGEKKLKTKEVHTQKKLHNVLDKT